MELNEGLSLVKNASDFVLSRIDESCAGLKPWQLILYTLVSTLVIVKTCFFLFMKRLPLTTRCKNFVFKTVRKIPFIGDKITHEIEKVRGQLCADNLFKLKPGMRYMQQLPQDGLSERNILKEVDEYLSLDHDWANGSVSGTVYNGSPELTNLVQKVCSQFIWSNSLHADVFQGLRKMEAEVVRMTCDLFHGHPVKSCGVVTSGGTESILLAMKAYRDWAYDNGIEHPEIVCPVSAHAAFEKAAKYFGMKITMIPLNAKTWKVDMRKMKKAITKNTCVLVGSAPQFPHGIIDPIVEIANLGERYGIPVHVDACLGGFLIAFMDEAGFPLEPFDFRLPGVTSISADTHKYGFAPKGTSVIMYSSSTWRSYQFFSAVDWQGGLYCTPCLGGSRTGMVIAGCWASMVKFGRRGYVDCTRKIVMTLKYITKQLETIENIYVIGKPEVSIVAIGSLDFDIFLLSTALNKSGWNLNSLQFPSAIHLCCTLLHTNPGVADRFIADVRRSVTELMMQPKQKNTGSTAMYGVAQTIPDRGLVSELASFYLDATYDTNSGVQSTRNGHL